MANAVHRSCTWSVFATPKRLTSCLVTSTCLKISGSAMPSCKPLPASDLAAVFCCAFLAAMAPADTQSTSSTDVAEQLCVQAKMCPWQGLCGRSCLVIGTDKMYGRKYSSSLIQLAADVGWRSAMPVTMCRKTCALTLTCICHKSSFFFIHFTNHAYNHVYIPTNGAILTLLLSDTK